MLLCFTLFCFFYFVFGIAEKLESEQQVKVSQSYWQSAAQWVPQSPKDGGPGGASHPVPYPVSASSFGTSRGQHLPRVTHVLSPQPGMVLRQSDASQKILLALILSSSPCTWHQARMTRQSVSALKICEHSSRPNWRKKYLYSQRWLLFPFSICLQECCDLLYNENVEKSCETFCDLVFQKEPAPCFFLIASSFSLNQMSWGILSYAPPKLFGWFSFSHTQLSDSNFYFPMCAIILTPLIF